MTISTTAAPAQVAINDIGTAEDFMAAIDATIKYFNDGDIVEGTIVKVAVVEGDTVSEGDLIVVLEAMKMEQPLNAHRSGVIKGLDATAGQTVISGATLCEIVDAE